MERSERRGGESERFAVGRGEAIRRDAGSDKSRGEEC